ncbi:methyltransferase domain-containing protein [Jatrophihabitans telluris]|uniref:Methyltransferase domain-containing protein n=1 Tax=Jatrophihabitans telluris TaxID=2038343 RepID=A0ABY4QTF7_9ACTN|nr:methyltransferase domain-containing protein [Jatrophihabitans telluris]UQX86989.1 methyltransferase domain-containing protein [Jatrophihabitans telluris]
MTDEGYVLGHSEAELRRLETQARMKDPITRRFAIEAGVGPGMRVLDVGSGAGDVAVLLADLVGEHGQVVGVDRSVVGVAAARAKVAGRGLSNVAFVVGGAAEVSFDEPFDAVVGRYVLQFQPDPAAMLAALASHAKPGAPIVFHELDWSGVRSVPSAPLYDRVCRWCVAAVEGSGASAHMGLGLAAAFTSAGLPEPVLRLESLIAAAEHARDNLALIANIARTLAPAMAEHGIAQIDELDPDTLVDRMQAEVLANGTVLTAHLEIGAWAYQPRGR